MSANLKSTFRDPGRILITETLLIALAIAGCVPLQQAPLVYSSAQLIGARVGINPTQADTAEVVVGVKIVDAAYAPVAVARHEFNDYLKSNSRSGISDDLFKIHEIYGQYGNQKTVETIRTLSNEERDDLKEYLLQATNLNILEKNLESQKETIKKIEHQRESTKTLIANLKEVKEKPCQDAISEIETKRISELIAISNNCLKTPGIDTTSESFLKLSAAKELIEQPTQTDDPTITDLTNAENIKKEELSTTKSNKAKQETELRLKEERVKRSLDKISGIEKRDAISVYGSFNSDTTASTGTPLQTNSGQQTSQTTQKDKNKGITLTIGKVFSTGVAAQNLSEAQKVLASAAPLNSCIQALPAMLNYNTPGKDEYKKLPDTEKAKEDNKRNELIKTYLSSCGEMAAKIFDDKKGK
ncbi:hypothetical protein [Niveibacterium terrae]|uniref:hypothetical protein n=1 Tax=Niveibacterium terrae TaxID=3373598 RepID=UPI003A8E29FE